MRGKNLPIGVDLGSGAVKMVQIHRFEDKLDLVAAASVAVPEGSQDSPVEHLRRQARAIRGALKSQPFHGRQCVLSVPAADASVQHVKLPRMAAEDIPAALRAELNGKLPYPTDQALIRHVMVGESRAQSEPRMEVLAVAMAGPRMDAYLAMARSAQLDVIGVNIECCAIVECFSRLFRRASEQSRAVLFVDLGMASTQAVLSQGGQIRFARNLAMGCSHLDQALAEQMGVSVDEARAARQDAPGAADTYDLLAGPLDRVADELRQCLRYCESVFQGSAVERIIFVGGGAKDSRLCQALARRLNLPAQVGDPLMRIQRPANSGISSAGPEPTWAVAVGLSLGAETNGKEAA